MSNFDDLWCEDCGKSHEGMCKKHGALHKVQDAVIPSRAKLTLPPSLTLKMVKENGLVYTGVFSKKTIPVRSQFGPLDAPVVSKTKIDLKPQKAVTVWKKKHAMQKALETSGHSHGIVGETTDMNQSSSETVSPVISSIKPEDPVSIKSLTSAGTSAEVAISSIQQQLMSITSQSISQSGAGDPGFIGLQSLQPTLHSSPVGNHHANNQIPFQQGLQDLSAINFQTSHGNIQFSHEQLQQLQQHYQAFGQQELAALQQNLNLNMNINEAASPNHMPPMGMVEHQSAMLTPIAQPLEVDCQSANDSGIVETSHQNVSDSTDVTSDTELEESTELDMSFELKVVTEDSFIELMDNTDEDHSNWMIFVRPAKTLREQNLIAYQEDGCIFFVSLKPIPSNTELRVWYSKDYAKSIGKGMLASEEASKPGDGKLQCLLCEVRFHDQEEMDTHLCVGEAKMKGRRKSRPRKYVKPTKTWRAKLEKSRVRESQPTNKDVKSVRAESGKVNLNEVLETPRRGRGRRKVKEDAEQEVAPTFEETPVNQVAVPVHVAVGVDMKNDTNSADVATDMADDRDDDFEESLHIDDEENDPMYKAGRLEVNEVKTKKKRGPKTSRAPIDCPYCGEKFVSEATYYVHVYQHTGVKPFQCDYANCGRGFLSKFKLERHRLIHTSPRHHKCPYCDKSFNRKDHLKNHMITHDPNKRIWKCELCSKEYCYSFSYRTHMAFHKAESGETLSCLICKKEFDDKNQLLFHLKIHTGARAAKNSTEKTHSCFECGKKFFTRKDVKRHMITHTKLKDYLCQHCPQRFGRKDHLTRHLRTSHSGDNQNGGNRVRRNTGENNVSPSKRKERQIYTNTEPTMVPFPVALQAVQPEDLHEQLINGAVQVSQNGTMASSQTTFLQNLQYAMSQLPGRDIQIMGIYEAATLPQDQQQQQQQQQPQQQQPQQQPQVSHTLPAIQTSLPIQYQVNDKGYLMNPAQSEQTLVRQIQLSPNIDYKQLTQQLQGNMYMATGATATLQQTVPDPQQQQQRQQEGQTVQQIPIQIQQQQLSQGGVPQAIIGKIEPVEGSRGNNIAILQQPPEYQLSVQPVSIVQTAASTVDQNRTSLVMANAVDAKPNSHSQTYSSVLGYVETLRFLENLPTNNTNTVPLQQLQTVNVDVSQAQQAQLIPNAAYNAVMASGSSILNINQVDLPKGVVAISNQHATLQLTPQELKSVVSLGQTVTPVQVTYQQQPS